jgi:hypothetical protein
VNPGSSMRRILTSSPICIHSVMLKSRGLRIGITRRRKRQNFSLRCSVQPGSEAHKASYVISVETPSLCAERPERQEHHPYLSRAEIKNAWSFTCTVLGGPLLYFIFYSQNMVAVRISEVVSALAQSSTGP